MTLMAVRLPSGAYPAHTGPGGDAYAEPTTLGKRPGPASGKRASSIVPPRGWVRLEDDDDPSMALLCRLGEGNLDLTSGIGGWDVVRRPGRTPVTRWRGRSDLRVDVPLWLNHDRRESIEPQVTLLTGLAGRGPKGSEEEPPHLVFDTGGISPWDAQTYPDQRWVIDALTWGSNVLFNHAGNRWRQDATITLLQFIDDQLVSDKSLALRRKQRRGKLNVPKTYHVKKGDTLVSIARKELGSVDRWLDIRKLNPGVKTDPRRELTPPLTLRLR
jgi:nucleoid-associated protein YgaU